MSKCPVTVAFDYAGKAHLLYCGLWSCPHCSKELARQWANAARHAFADSVILGSGQVAFLTLTMGSSYGSVQYAYSQIPRLWDATRKAYQRSYGRFSYMAFIEGQPNRRYMPHFHILSGELPPVPPGKSGRVTQHAIHGWAHALGWGFQAKLELVSSRQGAIYVAKYASKGSPVIPKGFRRVRTSRDIKRSTGEGGLPWLVRRRDEYLIDFLLRVEEVSHVPVDSLYDRYQDLLSELAKIDT